MTNHLETRRDVLQHLRHILPQLAKRPTTTRALRLGLMDMNFAWKMFR